MLFRSSLPSFCNTVTIASPPYLRQPVFLLCVLLRLFGQTVNTSDFQHVIQTTSKHNPSLRAAAALRSLLFLQLVDRDQFMSAVRLMKKQRGHNLAGFSPIKHSRLQSSLNSEPDWNWKSFLIYFANTTLKKKKKKDSVT